MPPRTRRTAPPADLAAKKAASVTNLAALEAEVDTEVDDGSVIVPLVTDLGAGDIRVPALDRWRSVARNALFSRGDDLLWAQRTLSVGDYVTWTQLDPTKDEADEFFAAFGRATGQSLGK